MVANRVLDFVSYPLNIVVHEQQLLIGSQRQLGHEPFLALLVGAQLEQILHQRFVDVPRHCHAQSATHPIQREPGKGPIP